MVAAPQQPSLKLPQPVTDLTAQRTGNQVVLHWTMPKRATDKVQLVGDQKARICRTVESSPCVTAGTQSFAPDSKATFTDVLPADLASGQPRLLTYTVELLNHAGHTAGPSNPAFSAAGTAPIPVAGLRAQAQAEGIVLSWIPQGGDEQTIRLQRTLVDKPVQKQNTQTPQLPPQQTLESTGPDKGQVLDADATLDHTYTYTAQRVQRMTLQGHALEIVGETAAPITINARDTFPPAVPQQLQAVADPEGRAIDLSWQPDTEPDLAGYIVYRSEAGAQPQRLTASPQPSPSFRDTKVQPGHAYEYAVSAIDQDGNESQRSAPVQEQLPQP